MVGRAPQRRKRRAHASSISFFGPGPNPTPKKEIAQLRKLKQKEKTFILMKLNLLIVKETNEIELKYIITVIKGIKQ